MKNRVSKLGVTRETIRNIVSSELERAQGGGIYRTVVAVGCSTNTEFKCVYKFTMVK